jgi:hypothetical protein
MVSLKKFIADKQDWTYNLACRHILQGTLSMIHQRIALVRSLYLIAILIASAILCSAQQPQPGPPQMDRNKNPERERQQQMSMREWNLRNLGSPPDQPDRKQLVALMAQTEEDFNRILSRHNEIARAISSKQTLDYEFVTEATAEIRKRASRLQATLALRESGIRKESTETPAEPDDEEMKSSLVTLCKLIRAFVSNPVIETPGTVHLEHTETARRDLANIVKLSSRISENAEKLGKSLK